MISSDKAVRPTSIMGATKRVAELAIRSLQNGSTRYVSVRFGNVLGSNGSVVPLFKEQIARGGPITVTHPDMVRYFMTIPEACQLVLQSSTMAQGGEIFVLDMGKPVRIVDLARNLILLSGLRPDQDVKIQFTGVRPGEKLYEELNLHEEDMVTTRHEKIMIFPGTRIPWPVMEQELNRLRRLCDLGQLTELVLALKEIIPDYNPSADLLRRALKPAAPTVAVLAQNATKAASQSHMAAPGNAVHGGN
jgi:FlaA1/EpsC-like NDP-sugar epimerase